MISRTHRFHGHNSLNYVYRNGQNIRGSLTALKYTTNSRRTEYRLAVVVSKKVSKLAVVRNRIRRRLYEAVRRHETQINQPYDIVITVFSDTLQNLPADQIEQLVEGQLKEAEIIT
jgi:ribonuclease P protein component